MRCLLSQNLWICSLVYFNDFLHNFGSRCKRSICGEKHAKVSSLQIFQKKLTHNSPFFKHMCESKSHLNITILIWNGFDNFLQWSSFQHFDLHCFPHEMSYFFVQVIVVAANASTTPGSWGANRKIMISAGLDYLHWNWLMKLYAVYCMWVLEIPIRLTRNIHKPIADGLWYLTFLRNTPNTAFSSFSSPHSLQFSCNKWNTNKLMSNLHIMNRNYQDILILKKSLQLSISQ